jgi:hypothetical protein
MVGDIIDYPQVPWMERRTGDRRGHRFSIVLHEHRTGFDRRRQADSAPWNSLLLYVRDHPTVLLITLLGLNVMNALDLMFTLRATNLGAGEANPLIRALLETRAPLVIAVKLLIVALASLAIWGLKRYRSALMAGVIAPTLYATVIAYEVINLAALGRL